MTNARQRLEVTNSPGSGTFKLGFRDEWAPTETPRHPAAGELDTYLETIPTIGAGNVLVSKESNWVYLIDFQAALANQPLPELVADYANLPDGCTVQITTLIAGEDEGQGPPTGDPKQDAINLAYAVLVRMRNRGPYLWPQATRVTETAIRGLAEFQTAMVATTEQADEFSKTEDGAPYRDQGRDRAAKREFDKQQREHAQAQFDDVLAKRAFVQAAKEEKEAAR